MLPKALHQTIDTLFEKIQHSRLYYEHYNNTIPLRTNKAYRHWRAECVAAYVREKGSMEFPDSPLRTQSATCLHGVFPGQQARAYSAKISELIERNDPAVQRPKGYEDLQIRISRPLETLGRDMLDIFRTPEVHEALLAFFHSHYRIEWVAVFRSLPSDRKVSSWMWHSDSYPPETCKLMLHLTPVRAETGATEFMNRADTMAYRRAGYFGQHLSERFADLEDFARQRGLPYRPYHFDAEPGDATLFDMNFFHRAIAPRSGIRDVIQFFLMPSLIPWEEQLARDGVLSMQPHEKLPPVPRRG